MLYQLHHYIVQHRWRTNLFTSLQELFSSVFLVSWVALVASITHFSIMFFSVLLCSLATNLNFCFHLSGLYSRLATSSHGSLVSHSSFTCSLVKAHLYFRMCHEFPFTSLFSWSIYNNFSHTSYLCSSDLSIAFCSLKVFISLSLCWISALCWTCWHWSTLS